MTILDTKNMDAQAEQKLKRGFKNLNRFMLLAWRLGLGKWLNAWPEVGGRIMVLIHTGRKTGKRHRTPINYAIVNGEVYCVAGFGPSADWYRNIVANPQVEVWLPDGWWAGISEELLDPERRLPLVREVIKASGAAGTALGVDATQLNDEELDKITQDYRLIRIRRTTARTGPGGPGDLDWVWPLSTFLLLFALIFRRRRR
jgi:deazaflavin-dependent oxidoreductase (nitroreductase family)